MKAMKDGTLGDFPVIAVSNVGTLTQLQNTSDWGFFAMKHPDLLQETEFELNRNEWTAKGFSIAEYNKYALAHPEKGMTQEEYAKAIVEQIVTVQEEEEVAEPS